MKQIVGLVAGLALMGAAQAQDGYSFYTGFDLVDMDLSEFGEAAPPSDNNLPQRTRDDFDANMLRARLGYFLNEDFAVEIQLGFKNDGIDPAKPEQAEIKGYRGIFFVPKAEPFDWLSFMFPLGYAETEVLVPNGDGTSTKFDRGSEAFGVNFQVSLKPFVDPGDPMGGLGIGGGFMVYHEGSKANLRGLNVGLQFVFNFGAAGDD